MYNWTEGVWYPGFLLGRGQVSPLVNKTTAISACPQPKSKKQVRSFLRPAKYYCQLILDFSRVASP